jgi:hypothetical protein
MHCSWRCGRARELHWGQLDSPTVQSVCNEDVASLIEGYSMWIVEAIGQHGYQCTSWGQHHDMIVRRVQNVQITLCVHRDVRWIAQL